MNELPRGDEPEYDPWITDYDQLTCANDPGYLEWLTQLERGYQGEDMSTIAKDTGGGDFQLAPAGNHVANCISVIDLGTQENRMYGIWQNKIFIQWELPEEMIEIEGENKPAIIGKFYTNSLSEKAHLRHDLESWRGKAFSEQELKGFDLANILGKPCMVNVIHGKKQNGQDKAEVSSVSPIPKGMNAPEPVNPLKFFSFDDFDEEIFENLSKGIKEMVERSKEYQERIHGPQYATTAEDDPNDDIPF